MYVYITWQAVLPGAHVTWTKERQATWMDERHAWCVPARSPVSAAAAEQALARYRTHPTRLPSLLLGQDISVGITPARVHSVGKETQGKWMTLRFR